MLDKAKEFTGTEVIIMALQNGGGIRASIDSGPITIGEVITVLPFGNTLAIMEVTGAELKQAFEISSDNSRWKMVDSCMFQAERWNLILLNQW